jgi:hypothetical protein
MPISSPANTIGVPGMVNSSPAATSARSGSRTTLRIRVESCDPSSDHEVADDRHGTAARNARTVAATASAGRRGTSSGSPP